ncbi:MAG: hypothetical protein ACOY7L_21515 [Pseudomonadota bacterium]
MHADPQLAIAHLAWLRSQGQQGLDCWTASIAVLDWARRNGRLTAANKVKLIDAIAELSSMLTTEIALAA